MCSPSLLCGHGLQLDQAFKRNKRDKNTACKLFPFFQWDRPSPVCAYIHSSRSLGLCFLLLLQLSDLWHGCFRSVSYTLLRIGPAFGGTQSGIRLAAVRDTASLRSIHLSQVDFGCFPGQKESEFFIKSNCLTLL